MNRELGDIEAGIMSAFERHHDTIFDIFHIAVLALNKATITATDTEAVRAALRSLVDKGSLDYMDRNYFWDGRRRYALPGRAKKYWDNLGVIPMVK